MTPFNLPIPTVQPQQSASEASAARKAAENEKSSNFKKALDEVAATGKAATKAVEAKKEEMKRVAAKDESSKPEVVKTEKHNKSDRSEKIKEKFLDKKQKNEERQETDVIATPMVEAPLVKEAPVELVFAGFPTVNGINNGQQSPVGPNVQPVMAMSGLDDVMQGGRSSAMVAGKGGPDSGGTPFGLRSASSSNSGQTTQQVNKSPLSAQSPTFSKELAERVGSIRLISRAGVSDQVRINLVPRDLGNLDIRLQVDSDNRVHMLVTTETEAAKDLLKNQMSHLKEAMSKQGMEFGDVDIQVDVKERENGEGAEAGLQWGGDGRLEFEGLSQSADGEEGAENDDPVILGKVIRASDGSMSVFI
ncbi:MAG: flagellar hook-length control protein FliK [Magnetococcales bacterium]|nr:flagellar hook-length control protein FliK [Magnetococcales bacterium]